VYLSLTIQVKSNTVLRNFYGHKAGPYSQPRAMWHPSEKYVIANSEDGGTVLVWSIASERVVETIAAHEAVVRDLTVSSLPSDGQTMMTVSYDKRVKIWQFTMESEQLMF
jgi:WD40 repeat protein